ncbi:MAG TPA: ferric reductase-like transmembrane domain-containing protein, partial [Candidatus Saccharimonadales bacterium]|nr:ferric reductase-like transmembrane domain-containing protein [Candidatus Saccharimonadales bacterium]
MTQYPKHIVAGLLFATYMGIPVVLWALAAQSPWASSGSSFRSAGQLAGIAGACLFSLNFILAARIGWIEELLRGLPRVYSLHHLFGGLAFILLLFHPVLLGLQYVSQSLSLAADFFLPQPTDIPRLFGVLALGILGGLLCITFFLRIAYHTWKSTHQWLGLALLFASLHVYLMPGNLSQADGLRPYMVAVIIAGLLAFGYRVLFGCWLVRRSPYVVQDVEQHADATEVHLSPAEQALRYKAGQFFFISVQHANGITREPHPFSFTSASASAGISFAAKRLGDYTDTLGRLRKGD